MCNGNGPQIGPVSPSTRLLAVGIGKSSDPSLLLRLLMRFVTLFSPRCGWGSICAWPLKQKPRSVARFSAPHPLFRLSIFDVFLLGFGPRLNTAENIAPSLSIDRLVDVDDIGIGSTWHCDRRKVSPDGR
jgi:hypothetical protein